MAHTKRMNLKSSSSGKKACFPGRPIPKDCQGPQSVSVSVAEASLQKLVLFNSKWYPRLLCQVLVIH